MVFYIMGKNEYIRHQLVIYSQLLAKRKPKKKKNCYLWEIPNVPLFFFFFFDEKYYNFYYEEDW